MPNGEPPRGRQRNRRGVGSGTAEGSAAEPPRSRDRNRRGVGTGCRGVAIAKVTTRQPLGHLFFFWTRRPSSPSAFAVRHPPEIFCPKEKNKDPRSGVARLYQAPLRALHYDGVVVTIWCPDILVVGHFSVPAIGRRRRACLFFERLDGSGRTCWRGTCPADVSTCLYACRNTRRRRDDLVSRHLSHRP